jgi:hypothetical protein
MKTGLLLLAAMLMGILTSAAENCRYVTVTTTNTSSPGVIQVQEGETAEITTAYTDGNGTVTPFSVSVQKDGLTMRGSPPGTYTVVGNVYYTGVMPRGTIVAGPATITLDSGSPAQPRLLTVKIIPSTYDVNKTLILPPGTNQVYVTLESSTNLVNWADATNGIYGSPITANFFRIRMAQLPSR